MGSGRKEAASSEEEVDVAVQFLVGCDPGRCLAHLRTLKLEVMLNALEGLKVGRLVVLVTYFIQVIHCQVPSRDG